MIKPCCVWLEHMLLNAGDSGICVVAAREGDLRQFYLQARPLGRHQARTWGRLVGAEPLKDVLEPLFLNERGGLAPLHTLMRVPILHCPHCGKTLEKLIRSQRSDFDDLAVAHAAFQKE